MAKIRKRGMNAAGRVPSILINLFFVVVMGVTIIPFVLLVTTSLTDNRTLLNEGYKFLPSKWSTAGYSYLFSNPRLVLDSYGVTIFVTLVGTLGQLVLCSLTAYALTKKRMPGVGFFTFLIFFTMLFRGGLVAEYIVGTQILGFHNRFRSMILPLMFNVWHVLIMRTYFMTSIPPSVEESAKIDGASDLRVFAQIVLPLSKPLLATIALFAALIYWNDWFQSLLYITNEHMYSLQFVMLQSLRQVEAMKRLLQMGAPGEVIQKLMQLPDESIRFAMVVVSIGPIVLAYPFFQRYFVKGMTIGAVKG
jgi:putative aldouronate transport system permease protein